jgi:GT2 family glycosyltransferase
VVELDPGVPFTAARARNAGFHRLLELYPSLDYVFFIDGDCEAVKGWLEQAARFLDQNAEVAVVWGRRRERFPHSSVYNLLCDIEWGAVPPGESKACGGDAVMRTSAFRQVAGYRADLIAGEEPELCVRLRKSGWRIWHLADEMTLHDAALARFGQWWKRTMRAGYAFAQGAALHGAPPERHKVKESRRAWLWGLGIPLASLTLCWFTGWWGLALLLVYPLQIVRLALRGKRSRRENWWYAGALVVGRFAEMVGQSKFVVNRLRRVQSALIEYK